MGFGDTTSSSWSAISISDILRITERQPKLMLQRAVTCEHYEQTQARIGERL
jgi:hypothetical protein